jgi:hypothetical protein
MPIFDEFRDAVANENLKICASYPSQRFTYGTIDFDRVRTQMADNSMERQNEQNRSFHLLNSRMMKDVVEQDVNEASAIKEISTGISATSQGYHWANQNQQVNAALTSSVHQLESTVASMQAMLYQIVNLVQNTSTTK